jgi:very-short-patch-repair endonuclease
MSALEDSLEWGLKHLAPELVGWTRQHVIAATGRKHAWDFAFESSRLVIDVQGGIYAKGRSGHSGASIEKDLEKLNLATCAGYRVLLFGPKDCAKRALAETCDVIRLALMAPR